MTSLVTTADLPESKRFRYWQEACSDIFFDFDCTRLSDRAFYGEIATTPIGQISFSRVCSRDHTVTRTPQLIRHANEEVLLIDLQLKGTGVLVQDGREAKVIPGDFVCHDSVRPGAWSSKEDFELLILRVPREILARRLGPIEQLTARTVRGNTPTGALVSNFFHQVAAVAQVVEPVTAQSLSEVSLALATTALGELISQPQDEGASWGRISLLYRAKALIEVNLHDPTLNSEKIARALKISVRYLQELFHQENATVGAWIHTRRLERCRRDLSDALLSAKSVGQIAFDCGFNDLSHFSHSFKKAFSIPPSEFRRQQRAATSHHLPC